MFIKFGYVLSEIEKDEQKAIENLLVSQGPFQKGFEGVFDSQGEVQSHPFLFIFFLLFEVKNIILNSYTLFYEIKKFLYDLFGGTGGIIYKSMGWIIDMLLRENL
jgi:hypothetical protein